MMVLSVIVVAKARRSHQPVRRGGAGIEPARDIGDELQFIRLGSVSLRSDPADVDRRCGSW
jgi:hypothetical protein